MIYNLLGYLPGPYIYGVVYQNTGSGKSVYGLMAIQSAGLVSVLMMFLLLIYKRNLDNKIQSKYSNDFMNSQSGAAT